MRKIFRMKKWADEEAAYPKTNPQRRQIRSIPAAV